MKFLKLLVLSSLVFVQHSFCGVYFASEHDFMEERRDVAARAILQILQADGIEYVKIPTVGVAFSGGSVRSAISTIAALQALSETGLIQTVSYVSATSGGCWGLGTVLAHFEADEQFRFSWQNIKDSVAAGNTYPCFDRDRYPREQFIQILKSKQLAKQPTGFVDLWGYILGIRFLQNLANNPNLSLSNLLQSPDTFPLPIFTAGIDFVTSNGCCGCKKHLYDFLEATPITCESKTLPNAISTRFFNSAFNAGRVFDQKPEPTLDFLFGVCGAAYSLSLGDLLNEAKGFLADLSSNERAEGLLVQDFLSRMTLENGRFCPAKVLNFAYNAGKSLAEEDQLLNLFDAGVLSNDPLYPLLRAPRRCDVVISIDSSEGCFDGKCKALIKSADFARTNGCVVPVINPSTPKAAAENVKVFEGGPDDPIIIEIYNPCKFQSTKFEYSKIETELTYNTEYRLLRSDETQTLIKQAIINKSLGAKRYTS